MGGPVGLVPLSKRSIHGAVVMEAVYRAEYPEELLPDGWARWLVACPLSA